MKTPPVNFTPPHCPNPNCLFHCKLSTNWQFKRIGYHWSQSQKMRIPRFLCRHCLLFHATLMRQAKPAATVAIDGFVSFEHSQFWPFHHHLAIEPASYFIVTFTDSEVRRSGSMTPAQQRESQTGDDSVVEASAVECGANGCICGVAELPEGPERENPL
jgi:hypothetical protein